MTFWTCSDACLSWKEGKKKVGSTLANFAALRITLNSDLHSKVLSLALAFSIPNKQLSILMGHISLQENILTHHTRKHLVC
jgi:hypothetical protein